MGLFSCFNKLFLVALNFVIFLFGTGIVALASIVIHKSSEYGEMLIDEGMLSLPIVILIIGLIITILGFFGCCGAVREHPCMLYTYATIVLCLFLAGLVTGILALMYPDEAKKIIHERLETVFNKYGSSDKSLDQVIDAFQHDFECCGIDSSTDWTSTPYGQIPISCCKVQIQGCNADPTKLYHKGCYVTIYDEVKKFSQILGIAAIVLAIVQFLCICIACGLAKKRSEYV